ncbi:MAG: DUF7844 domain-containing protein, partial [Bdellovibrio sp.]
MKTVFLTFVYLVLSFNSYASQSGIEKIELDNTTEQSLFIVQKKTLRLFLDQTLTKLPPQMLQALPNKIVFSFNFSQKLPSAKSLCEYFQKGDAKNEETLGSSLFPNISINGGFLKIIEKGPDKAERYDCGHRDFYRLAEGTLIHELSHIYDFVNAPANLNSKEKDFRARCAAVVGPIPTTRISPECLLVLQWKLSVSDRPPFRNLMSWKVGIFSDEFKNFSALRSPDPYEFTNLSEAFAVNMEFFLLDPQFACRRPDINEFLIRHFNFSPYKPETCKIQNQVFFSKTGIPVQIDPSRIYQIHYLLADKGEAMASRWGHAMFRIVQCARYRTKIGPECLSDIQEHVVLSFRGNISDNQTNAWKGLSGGYPSQLFIFSLPEIIREYTISEDRDLKSIPLLLSREEITTFAYRMLREYWDYQGRYAFIGNNCATESLDFVKGVVKSKLRFTERNRAIVTPKGLYDIFEQYKLLDGSVLASLEKSEAKGRYVFPSFSKRVKKAFSNLKNTVGFPEDLEFDDFFSSLNSWQRSHLFYKIKNSLSSEGQGFQIKSLSGQFYFIEMAILEKKQQSLLNERNNFFDNASEQNNYENFQSESVEILKRIVSLRTELQPAFLTHSGYGIPQEEDLKDFSEIKAKINELNQLT